MKKVVKLTESDLNRIVKRIIEEQEVSEFIFANSDQETKPHRETSKKERMMIQSFKEQIKNKLSSGGSDWSMDNKNPRLEDLISGIRRVCDKYEGLTESKSSNVKRISEDKGEVSPEMIISMLMKEVEESPQELYDDVYDWMQDIFSPVELKLEEMGYEDYDNIRMLYDDVVMSQWNK